MKHESDVLVVENARRMGEGVKNEDPRFYQWFISGPRIEFRYLFGKAEIPAEKGADLSRVFCLPEDDRKKFVQYVEVSLFNLWKNDEKAFRYQCVYFMEPINFDGYFEITWGFNLNFSNGLLNKAGQVISDQNLEEVP